MRWARDVRSVGESSSISKSSTPISLPSYAYTNDDIGANLRWRRDLEVPSDVPAMQDSIYAMDWIPGDTMRFRAVVMISMRGSTAHPAQGVVRTRWEYRVTVPEPSGSLSLPLGMAGLAGLFVLRGGA